MTPELHDREDEMPKDELVHVGMGRVKYCPECKQFWRCPVGGPCLGPPQPTAPRPAGHWGCSRGHTTSDSDDAVGRCHTCDRPLTWYSDAKPAESGETTAELIHALEGQCGFTEKGCRWRFEDAYRRQPSLPKGPMLCVHHRAINAIQQAEARAAKYLDALTEVRASVDAAIAAVHPQNVQDPQRAYELLNSVQTALDIAADGEHAVLAGEE